VMRNVEYKAELRDPTMARGVCAKVGAAYIITLDQVDTYFRVPSGRLKKREAAGEPTEWIFYERPDTAGARTSGFTIYTEEAAMERYGQAPLPVSAVVKKRRELYMLDGVRIHLDRVEGLGWFFELEALVTPRQKEREARDAVTRLIEKFRPALGEPVSAGYSDLATEADEG